MESEGRSRGEDRRKVRAVEMSALNLMSYPYLNSKRWFRVGLFTSEGETPALVACSTEWISKSSLAQCLGGGCEVLAEQLVLGSILLIPQMRSLKQRGKQAARIRHGLCAAKCLKYFLACILVIVH